MNVSAKQVVTGQLWNAGQIKAELYHRLVSEFDLFRISRMLTFRA
jgi:hypothetical protein